MTCIHRPNRESGYSITNVSQLLGSLARFPNPSHLQTKTQTKTKPKPDSQESPIAPEEKYQSEVKSPKQSLPTPSTNHPVSSERKKKQATIKLQKTIHSSIHPSIRSASLRSPRHNPTMQVRRYDRRQPQIVIINTLLQPLRQVIKVTILQPRPAQSRAVCCRASADLPSIVAAAGKEKAAEQVRRDEVGDQVLMEWMAVGIRDYDVVALEPR